MKQSLFLSLSFFLFFSLSGFAQESEAQDLETFPTTSIEFEDPIFMFGEIYQGEKVQNVFTFTNTGDEPLVMLSAKGSCGCTVPSWPKEPIMPGESAELLVSFNSKGKKGKQAKRVTIVTNTDPKTTYLTLKGEVIKSDAATAKIDVPPPPPPKTQTKVKDRSVDVDATKVTVFPNPSSEELNVSLKGYDGTKAVVDIFNIKGERMTTRIIKELNSEAINFDVRTFESGTYTVSIKLDGLNRITKQVTIVNQ